MEDNTLTPFYKALAIAYLLLHYSCITGAATSGGSLGHWNLLLNNTGVVATHMALTPFNTVLIFDQTGSAPSGYRLRRRYNGQRCRVNRADLEDSSCYSHSIEYNVLNNQIRPLFIEPDPLGSSGSFLSNGTLLELGGSGSGSKRIRFYRPCRNGRCDWSQEKNHLDDQRWYASTLRLPDNNDRVVVVGGRGTASYEFVPRRSSAEKAIDLPFLRNTYDRAEGGNNLYPILHLSPDGHLFIFANRDSILFNYRRNTIVKNFPRIPERGSRTYPSSGSSVLLPLDHQDRFQKGEVMVCGGAAAGAVTAAQNGQFLRGLTSCGRMVITGNRHVWNMEEMPGARLMHDMINLPNGDVLIINGVQSGCAGSNNSRVPALVPYLYNPKKKKVGSRFSLLRPTKIARMYHSSAVLLPDGRILVAGGNPNRNYVFRNVSHPTELRLQAFTPANMAAGFDDRRPRNVIVNYNGGVAYGGEFTVRFLLTRKALPRHTASDVVFTAYASPFNTHSISMSQRLLVLRCKNITTGAAGAGRRRFTAVVEAPPSPNVAPAGYYMISVINNGIPSRSQWVRFTQN